MKYFEKENPSGFGFNDGSVPQWVVRASGRGLLALDETKDAAHITEIESLIAKRMGGFVAISEPQFDAKKKHLSSISEPSNGLSTKPAPRLWRANLSNPALAALAGVAPSAAVPANVGPVAEPEAPAAPAVAPGEVKAGRRPYTPRVGKRSDKPEVTVSPPVE